MTPRSLTSDCATSALPVVSVCRVTVTKVEKSLLYTAIDSAISPKIVAR